MINLKVKEVEIKCMRCYKGLKDTFVFVDGNDISVVPEKDNWQISTC